MEQRIAALRQAIHQGAYVIDARLLAERLIASGVLVRVAKA